jgi:hypothetical protein
MVESAQAFVWGLVCLSAVWAGGAAVASFCEAIGEDAQQNETRKD